MTASRNHPKIQLMKLALTLKRFLLGMLLVVFTAGVTVHISNVEGYLNTDLKTSSRADFDQDGNVETNSEAPDYLSFAKVHQLILFSLPKVRLIVVPEVQDRSVSFVEPHLEFPSDYLSSIFRPPIFA